MVRISVVICTYKRAHNLSEALAGIQRQTLDARQFETIVVDNGVESEVEDLVKKASQSVPNLYYTHEERLGLSYARNRGAEIALGEWIVYLDDDAIPDENWLRNLLYCIDKLPKKGVIGGTVLPIWPHDPPKWLTSKLYPALSLCNYGDHLDAYPLDFPKNYPVGANIAYYREHIKLFGGFKPQLGRRGKLLLSGEETELNYRIYAAGYPIWFCPKAIVHHRIPAERLSRRFFRSRHYWSGRTWAFLHYELFGLRHLRQELISRMASGITSDLIRLISYVFRINHPLFINELYFRERYGYIIQGLLIICNKIMDKFQK